MKVVRKMFIKEIINEFKLDDEIDVNDDDYKYKVSKDVKSDLNVVM